MVLFPCQLGLRYEHQRLPGRATLRITRKASPLQCVNSQRRSIHGRLEWPRKQFIIMVLAIPATFGHAYVRCGPEMGRWCKRLTASMFQLGITRVC